MITPPARALLTSRLVTAALPHLRPFHPDGVDELLRFIHAHPVSDLGSALLRELLTHLPRTREHVLDVWQGGDRQLVATVVDTVENAAHSAVFAVLGLRVPRDPQIEEALAWTLEIAESQVRAGPRATLEIPLPAALQRHAPLLERRGYRVAFRAYHMTRPAADAVDPPALPATWRWADAAIADVPTYHALVASAFASVPGTHLTDLATFRDMFNRTPRRPRLLWHGDRLVGFVKTSLDADGETGLIHILGRDPAYRGQRLGPTLLREAMRTLASDGARRLRLEVIADNHSALELYLGHGFTVAAEEPTYQRDLPR